MKIRLTFFIVLGVCSFVLGQGFPKGYFRAPLDIPMYLSGNFGELRGNHYHSGIDIKTQGREGHNVYAVADGFVSRVKVSPYGYGNAIYITHPNGHTSVYGHLQGFSERIDSVVKDFQYQKESFAIDESLPKNRIRVKKGEVIAKSGNSGSSGGPHLHFEIRETKSEFPTNPLLYGFAIKDNVAPVMRALFLYPLNATSEVSGGENRKQYDLVKKGNSYSIKDDLVPTVSGKIGFALDARDYMNETHNYYGIYKLDFFVDDVLEHSFAFKKFSFGELRYINSHIDYQLYKEQKRRIHKLFHEQNQKESFASTVNRGIEFNDNNIHSVLIEIVDVYGNKSDLKFRIKSEEKEVSKKKAVDSLYCEHKNKLEMDGFFAEIPALALYKNIIKKGVIKKRCNREDSYAPLFHALSEMVPLQKNITVGITPNNLSKSLKKKAFVARENKGKYRFIGKKWQGDFLTAKTNTVGNFTILTDVVAPKIELWRGSSYKKTGKLRYKITDNLSGIQLFRGTIDGKWVLFEYDPKKQMIWHRLSRKRITKGKKHKLVLEVTDICGNKAVRKAEFTW